MIRLIRAIISIFALTVTARYFGVSQERDFWVLGTAAATIMMQLLFGPINEVFRTQSVHIRSELGDAVLARTNASLSSFFLWVSILIIVTIELFPGLVSHMIASGLVGPERERFEFFVRLIIPSLVLNQLVNGWISILNVYNVFYIPELYAIFSGLANILFIFLLTKVLGIGSLIVAMYATTIGLLFVLAREIWKLQSGRLIDPFPSFLLCKTMIACALPFYLPYFTGQLVALVEKKVSVGLGVGNASLFDYAQKFVQVPQGVIMGIIATVLAPALAAQFAQNQSHRMREDTCEYLRMIFLGLIPITILFTVSSDDLVMLFFSNKVSAVDRFLMAKVIRILAVGLFGVVLYSTAGQALVAQKKGKVYAFVAVLVQIIIVFLNLVWGGICGLNFLAFSWAATHVVLGFALLLLAGVTLSDIWRKFKAPMLILVGSLLAAECSHTLLITKSVALNIIIAETFGIACAVTGLYLLRQPERIRINGWLIRLRGIGN
ncbi:MAG TPA: lipid II flippase MurJ [Desulfuromonadaceae bacterium]